VTVGGIRVSQTTTSGEKKTSPEKTIPKRGPLTSSRSSERRIQKRGPWLQGFTALPLSGRKRKGSPSKGAYCCLEKKKKKTSAFRTGRRTLSVTPNGKKKDERVLSTMKTEGDACCVQRRTEQAPLATRMFLRGTLLAKPIPRRREKKETGRVKLRLKNENSFLERIPSKSPPKNWREILGAGVEHVRLRGRSVVERCCRHGRLAHCLGGEGISDQFLKKGRADPGLWAFGGELPRSQERMEPERSWGRGGKKTSRKRDCATRSGRSKPRSTDRKRIRKLKGSSADVGGGDPRFQQKSRARRLPEKLALTGRQGESGWKGEEGMLKERDFFLEEGGAKHLNFSQTCSPFGEGRKEPLLSTEEKNFCQGTRNIRLCSGNLGRKRGGTSWPTPLK